jgi:hypothetical protein
MQLAFGKMEDDTEEGRSSPLAWLGPSRPAPAPWATAAVSRTDGLWSQEKITREEGRGTVGEGRGSRENEEGAHGGCRHAVLDERQPRGTERPAHHEHFLF